MITSSKGLDDFILIEIREFLLALDVHLVFFYYKLVIKIVHLKTANYFITFFWKYICATTELTSLKEY